MLRSTSNLAATVSWVNKWIGFSERVAMHLGAASSGDARFHIFAGGRLPKTPGRPSRRP